MVYRIYVEKKSGLDHEAKSLLNEINTLLEIKSVKDIRLLNRYDVENITKKLFTKAVKTVFSEPQLDNTIDEIDADGAKVFAVEYLPGQFDQRADSAAQCIQLIAQCERPTIRTAKVYMVYGELSEEDIKRIKSYVINPVESREANLKLPETLKTDYDIPTAVETVEGFCEFSEDKLDEFIKSRGLAMDLDDVKFCQKYFIGEKREPTITEIKMIDTYWSDHCRHTTFLTTIDNLEVTDEEIKGAYDLYLKVRKKLKRKKPVNLMDIATMGMRYLKSEGKLNNLDESDEINACTVKIKVDVDGVSEDWLLLFKNETHNHPTEIEPFGGAATCIGGAIRDPLSGRAYVYSAMRITGAGDPLVAVKDTIEGKLPQRKIVTTAANGYSSYGNQIGLATGMVEEIYHKGYVAKRMEIGAVIGATPQDHVRRECPKDGDIVILLGGRTGRDGCGGATGSSKAHTHESLASCGAEVQKGNAPEERKLQRLFRNKNASCLIKRCNDFGAGGVSVAIGELADGVFIDLNKIPKKYDGLDGTELAISESQERMAVVVELKDADKFIEFAEQENLEATKVAVVTETPRLVMVWNGKRIVDISREFLNSNGAEKHINVKIANPRKFEKKVTGGFTKNIKELAADLNVCGKRGLSERFDSTIGAGTVLMPFGGKYQITPIQAMVNKVSLEKGETDDCSVMSYGFNPFISEASPYHGAYLAVIESVSKLIATGADFNDVYLTFQEYFPKPKKDAERWGLPAAALLGAFKAQYDLGVASIGGKDSMSGTFENIDVPPTLVSFAVTMNKTQNTVSPEFKSAGSKVVLIAPDYNESGLPEIKSLKKIYKEISYLVRAGKVLSAYTLTYGGIAEAVMKMCFGNGLGFEFEQNASGLFDYNYGSFILELADEHIDVGMLLGTTTEEYRLVYGKDNVDLKELQSIYENKLEDVFACNIATDNKVVPEFDYRVKEWTHAKRKVAAPRVLIPVFPGTNCEYDTARAFERAGAEADVFVINNQSPTRVAESVKAFAEKIKKSQIIFIPGGFSGGDEPDGSGKFITAFFKNAAICNAVAAHLDDKCLIGGICNGFQALIKLGLVPYGRIIDTDEKCPTLTFNDIGRHQSRLVRTRIASNKSPWLADAQVGDIYTVAISHGEGKFIASPEVIEKLVQNGQIFSQYVDLDGKATFDIRYNPNGSYYAIEGITSEDGLVFGKMGHTERYGEGLYRNVDGRYDLPLFTSAVKYFK